jgi:hypothetical protein
MGGELLAILRYRLAWSWVWIALALVERLLIPWLLSERAPIQGMARE